MLQRSPSFGYERWSWTPQLILTAFTTAPSLVSDRPSAVLRPWYLYQGSENAYAHFWKHRCCKLNNCYRRKRLRTEALACNPGTDDVAIYKDHHLSGMSRSWTLQLMILTAFLTVPGPASYLCQSGSVS
jgi:hypothetical protein